MLRRILAFLVAIATMAVLGSIAHSLFVQQAWLNAAAQSGVLGEGIAFGERWRWILHDLVGLQPLYGGLSATALLLGMLIAGAVTRFTGQRRLVFAIAGAACIFTLFSLLKLALGTVGVFGARGAAGLAVQMLAGLGAGMVFALLTEQRAASSNNPPVTT